ncbi:MAG: glycosyltransferase family 39 protein [Ktedonobacteraceae bacterium]
MTSNSLLCILFCVIALALNLYRLGVPGVWFDEAFSVELARQPLPLLWHIIFGPEPNMELYYLLLHAWLAVTAWWGMHPTEFVVRFPSAIFAALSVVVVFLLGQHLSGRTVGIVAASLYLLNDLQLVYAQQARSYSLQLLLVCLAWYALFHATLDEARQWRWWLCFVIATTLALYAHLFSLFLLLAQLCTFGIWSLSPASRYKARQQWRAGLLSLICIALLCLPLLPLSLQPPKTDWLPVPHVRDLALLLFTISGANKIYACMIVACCGLTLCSALARVFSRSQGTLGWRGWDMCPYLKCIAPCGYPGARGTAILPALLCWLFVPIIVTFVLSQGSIRLFSSRYLVTAVPPLLLLVAMGITTVRWRYVRLVLTLGLLLLALQSVPFYYSSAQVEDWNTATFWLEHQYQTGDGLVCYDNAVEQGCQIAVEYYLHAYPSAAHFTSDAPGAFFWTTFRSDHPEAAVDPLDLATFAAKHTRLFFIVGRLPNARAALLARQAQQWLDSRYHCIAQIVTRTVTVRLYMTEHTVVLKTPGGIS